MINSAQCRAARGLFKIFDALQGKIEKVSRSAGRVENAYIEQSVQKCIAQLHSLGPKLTRSGFSGAPIAWTLASGNKTRSFLRERNDLCLYALPFCAQWAQNDR